MPRYIIATMGMSRKKGVNHDIYKIKMSIHGCHEKTRASSTCMYLTIQLFFFNLPCVAVEFDRMLPPLNAMSGDSKPAGLFACWASDTFMRKCFGRLLTGDFPPNFKSYGTEVLFCSWQLRQFIHSYHIFYLVDC